MEKSKVRAMNALMILGGLYEMNKKTQEVIAEKIIKNGKDAYDLSVREIISLIGDEQLKIWEAVIEARKKQQSLAL
ncbi:MAG: hypothetical protein COB30_015275 [Ectothiorhodospiraceae bacterium]|nr:hypothetical protein [Ectothiorhodospiraceae bacterium]